MYIKLGISGRLSSFNVIIVGAINRPTHAISPTHLTSPPFEPIHPLSKIMSPQKDTKNTWHARQARWWHGRRGLDEEEASEQYRNEHITVNIKIDILEAWLHYRGCHMWLNITLQPISVAVSGRKTKEIRYIQQEKNLLIYMLCKLAVSDIFIFLICYTRLLPSSS